MDPAATLALAAVLVLGGSWARSRAGKVGVGTWLGLLFAAIAKVVIAFLMIAIFLAFYLVNSSAA